MRRRLNSFLAILCTICMFVTVFPVNVQGAENFKVAGIDIGYAVGSYFTDNGQACTDHGTKGIHDYYDESACNCICTYNGQSLKAVQCFGFARYVQSKIFGINSASNSSSFYQISGVAVAAGALTDVNTLKNIIMKAKVGAHLRTNKNSSGDAHSMIITEITDSGFSIVDCNSVGACKIDARTYTWSGYINSTYGKRGIEFIELPKEYNLPVVDNNPIGSVTSISGGYNSISLSGWAFDNDDTSAELEVHVYIGGAAGEAGAEGYPIIANQQCADAEPQHPGVGTNHGFSATIPTTKTGIQKVYVYACNVGEGEHTILWSGDLNISLNPVGKIDTISAGYNNILLSGWTFDPNVLSEALEVHVYIGGEAGETGAEGYPIVADKTYTGLDELYPEAGANHGFDAVIPTNKTGQQNVYVYACNKGEGETVLLWNGVLTIKVPERTLSDGRYHIVSALDHQKVIEVEDASMEEKANIQLFDFVNKFEQTFDITYIGDGYYKIINANSGKCLDVEGAGTDRGTNVQQFTYVEADQQQWIISVSDDGRYYNIISKHSGKCLDVTDAKTDNGTNIQICNLNGNNAQKWQFIAWGADIGRSIPEGEYQIASALDTNKTIDVSNASLENNANIQLHSSLGDPYQYFNISYLGEGYYKIINTHSEKSLDIPGGTGISGSNVQQYDWNSGNGQQWIIKDAGDGYYYIISKWNGMYLDVAGGVTDDGTNIQVYVGNQTAAQKWKLIENDNENPVIGDVAVSDISETGYTVSCKVTDNFAVDRVQFPTWTLENDQDDIDSSWSTSEKSRGTKDGDTYTFRVNISDHNNEYGIYRTHIYAYDKSGNSSSCQVEDVTIPSTDILIKSSGTCGENLTWKLSQEGILTISGTGAMDNYYYAGNSEASTSAPWVEYADIITEVIIEEGVTSIGSYSFMDGNKSSSKHVSYPNIKSVSIPETVVEIGECAFAYCSGLTELHIPDGVTSIGDWAFYSSGIKSIEWGEAVNSIGANAFSGTQITSLTIPETVQSIGTYAFSGCSQLQEVNLPNECEIYGRAFQACNILERVVIGESCKMDYYVFKDCTQLSSVSIGEGSIASKLDNSDPKGMIFEGCTALESISLPDSWKFYDGTTDTVNYVSQFAGCTNLKEIVLKNSNEYYKCVDNVLYSKDGVTLIYYPLGITDKEYKIVDGTSVIGCFAFDSQPYIEYVELPYTVTSIQSHAFSRSNIKSIIIPDSVTEVSNAFYQCVNLKEVAMSENVTELVQDNKQSIETFNPLPEIMYGKSGSYTETFADEQGITFEERTVIQFNANGGKLTDSYSYKVVLENEPYRTLPIPEWEGYVFEGWYTDADAGEIIEASSIVTENKTLYAHWRDNTQQPVNNPFTDVSEGDFYYDAVLWAVQNEITTGISATIFAPDANCTRGQVVTFLWRANGEPEPTMTKCTFTDIAEGDYYYDAVLWAVENGITTGRSETSFAPNDNCTRDQVVTFLHRASGSVKPEITECSFTDVEKDAFYYDAMLWAVENGITTGKSETSFAPSDICTRGQVVTFLYRVEKQK